MSKQLLVIFGATGQQGSSIIDQLLRDADLASKYAIRGLSRDPSSATSQALKNKGVEIVRSDPASDEDVKSALHGADVVFLMTSSIYSPTGGKEEEALGNHLADLVVESGAKYLVWSSMISPAKLSGGKFTHVDLFESKYEVEQYIRTLPIKSSFFVPGSFMQNYLTQSTPRPLGDGTYGLFNFFTSETTVPLIDIASDTGKWVVPMITEPEKYAGRHVACATKAYKQSEIAAAMSKATGKTIKHIPISVEQFESYLPESFRTIVSQMWQYIGEFGYYGANTNEELEWGHQQAKGDLTTIDEFFQQNKLPLEGA